MSSGSRGVSFQSCGMGILVESSGGFTEMSEMSGLDLILT